MGHTIQQHCCKDTTFWVYIGAIVGLLAFSGLMSGLTLGLMSLGLVDLEVIKKSGKPEDQKNAAKILPVVKNQHLLLVTLLVGNALAMEALPLFLDSVVSTYMAIVLSVTLLLMFGEILPQAVCSRYGLAVGAAMTPLVRVLIVIMFPVAYPLSKLLDFLLGKKHSILFGRAELRTLVDMHGNEAGKGGDLNHYETTIISGALSLTEKIAGQAMTPISETFSIDVSSKLDRATMAQILASGHSRIPVYAGKPNNIVGVVLVKSLVSFDRPTEDVPIADLAIRRIPRVSEDMPLYDILHEFQQGRSHMAAVVRYNNYNNNNRDPDSTATNPARHHVVTYDHVVSSDQGTRRHCKRISDRNIVHGSHKLISLELPVGSPSPVRSNEPEDQQQLQHLLQQQQSMSNGKHHRVQPWTSWADEEGEVVGIITLEDVLEELLQEEILDEKDCSMAELSSTRIPEDRSWTLKTPSRAISGPPTPPERPQPPPLSPVRIRYSISAPGSPKRNSTVSALETPTGPPAKRISAVSAPGSPTYHVQRAAAQHNGRSPPGSPGSVVCVTPRGLARVRLGTRASVTAVNESPWPSVAINSRIHMHRVLFSNSNSSKEHERPKTAPAYVIQECAFTERVSELHERPSLVFTASSVELRSGIVAMKTHNPWFLTAVIDRVQTCSSNALGEENDDLQWADLSLLHGRKEVGLYIMSIVGGDDLKRRKLFLS